MKYVEFSYSKRRPKKIENGVFVLYTPGRSLKSWYELTSEVIKKSCGRLCIATFTKLLNTYHISTDSLALEDSPYRIIFEIQNRNMNKTIQLRAKTELGFFTILNSGATEDLRHKFIKCNEL